MTNKELVAKAKDIAKNYKTLYVKGCFGSPLTDAAKKRYTHNNPYNMTKDRVAKINKATSDVFGFDCVCLIKGILWGWTGNKANSYGGAVYKANGVPDTNADGMIKLCKNVSTDFSKIEVGEAVWMPGHIGIYIGNNLAVECTPIWKDCVQITACNHAVSGYNRRNWTKHGKLPWVTYVNETPAPKVEPKKETPKLATTTTASKYFPKYTGKSVSIVDGLAAVKASFTYSYRAKIAKANGIKLYVGTAKQNGTMLNLLKQGKLIKP